MTETSGLYQTPFQTFLEGFKVVFLAIVIALLIRTFIVQPYYIPSDSMLNTLLPGDRIFVSKFSYGIHLPFNNKEIFSISEPERGDIIVFPFPENPKDDYIKRVVGLPGDHLEIRNKQLYCNGKAVHESYIIHGDPRLLERGHPDGRRDNMDPLTVPPGKVFVMGDNRDNSKDSRYWGFVDISSIRGKAQVIFWSSDGFNDIRWERFGKSLY